MNTLWGRSKSMNAFFSKNNPTPHSVTRRHILLDPSLESMSHLYALLPPININTENSK